MRVRTTLLSPIARTTFRSRGSRALAGLVAFATLGAVVVAAPPAQASSSVTGMDISSWQHLGGRSINWTSVRNSGQSFTIIKATEGLGYTNPYYAGDAADSQRVGLVRGAYHYARPSKPVIADAVDEARFFIATAGQLAGPGVLPPILDLEENGGLNSSDLIAWTRTWLSTVQSLTGRTPIIYTYRYFWSTRMASTHTFIGYPLWLADYNSTFGGTVGGWPTWAMWQYTAGASVPGVYGKVDMSRFNGSVATLVDFANGQPIAPPAPALPPAPTNVVAGGVDASGTALITWMASADASPSVTSYTVTASPGDISTTVTGDQTIASISGLDPAITYTFSVVATNEVGSSAPASTGGLAAGPPPVVPASTTLTMDNASATVWYGDSAALNARLARADDGQPLVGRSVILEATVSPGGGYTQIASLQTGADGAVSAVVKPLVTTRYRFRYDGLDDAASSATADVSVRLRISSKLNAVTAKVGQKLVMSGHVSPVRGGYVYRQQAVGGVWTTLARTAIQRGGTFAFRVTPVVKGVKSYRVMMPSSTAYAATSGTVVHLRVR